MASWSYRHVTDECLLPYVDAATAPPEVQAAFKTLPFERKIFRLMANAPTIYPIFMKQLQAVWSEDTTLRPSEWQLATLRTLACLDCSYAWFTNEPVSKILGFSDEKLSKLQRGDLRSRELFTDRERIAAKLMEEMTLGNKASEETTIAARNTFGNQGLMELMFINGTYSTIGKAINSCKIDHDEHIPDLVEKLRKFNIKRVEKEENFVPAPVENLKRVDVAMNGAANGTNGVNGTNGYH